MGQDILSDVLRGVRLRGAVFFNITASSDWAAEAPPGRTLAPLLNLGVDHVVEYHAVVRGNCWAGIPDGPVVQLRAGDVVMFPHGDPHVVSSAPGLRGNLDMDWFAGVQGQPLPLRLAYSGSSISMPPDSAPYDPGDTAIVCGFLGCDLRPFNPLIEALPRLMHLRADGEDTWLASFVRQAVAESQARRAGGEAMLARMSEMMFVHAVRRFADQQAEHGTGWLAGLRDRFVGRALALMHEQPERPWTLDELGQRIGLSRSALHDRFVDLVGVAPMQYLTQWRMQAASRMLLESQAGVASIALDVGYESEAAFSRAFKRLMGQPPGAWRRSREAPNGGAA
ncbi:MAG: AraC family transcriptional regulator [Proteobacteria bacterium]|nr:AraC family transcriptional regulator [Pseudomonadota bacterium]